MFSNRTLQAAFLISVATHLVIVAQNPGYVFFSSPAKNKKIEINYIKAPNIEKKGAVKRTGTPVKPEPFLKLPSKITAAKGAPPPFVERDTLAKSDIQSIRKEMPFDKPALIKPDISAIKRKISLPAVDLDKIGNPSYISYYQVVREKIRRAVYQSYGRSETGEVYISFVVSSAGYLTYVHVVDEKSSAPGYLRDIALASVKNASPFPKFPKELDYQQLSFNVVISFEEE